MTESYDIEERDKIEEKRKLIKIFVLKMISL